MKFLKRKLEKKIVLGATLLLILTIFVPRVVQAKYIMQTKESNLLEEYKQSLETEGTNLPQWSLYNMNYIALGLTRMILGAPVLEEEEQTNRGGAMGLFAGLIEEMYQNKPVSSGRYLAYLGRNLKIIKPAYAQGKGWQFLEPILPFWRVVRDVTYLFFVVAFVALGFMIMFRQKLDPQTAISIQNAIPRIIVALILVTFSYALCGFLVDLVYFGNTLMEQIFRIPLKSVGGKDYFWTATFHPANFAAEFTGIKSITDAVAAAAKNIVGLLGALKGDFASIFNLIITFSLFGSIIKIFFALLSRYVMLIIYTIFSPIFFLWGTLPGQEEHISRFIKSFLSAVLSFPAILLLLNFASAIVAWGRGPSPADFTELSPFSTSFVKGKFDAEVLTSFIGLGIIMAAAKITEAIDDALAVKPGVAPAMGAETAGIVRRIPIIGGLVG